MTGSGKEQGAILFTVLMVLAVVAGIAATLVGLQRNAVTALQGEETEFRRDIALRSALAELGAKMGAERRAVPRTGESFLLGDAISGQVTTRVQAISGLVNANSGSPVLLAGLMRQCGASPETEQGLVDTIVGQRQAHPFLRLEDIEPLLASSDVAWRCVQAGLSVWGTHEMLDPDTAPLAALLSVPGMTKEAAQTLIAERDTPAWGQHVRAEKVELYRPFLGGQDQGVYIFSLRYGADLLSSSGVGLIWPDGQFHLIGLGWPDLTPREEG